MESHLQYQQLKRDGSERKTLGRGLLSGGLGTAPMTAVMVAIDRQLPKHQQGPMPQRQIVEDFLAFIGMEEALSDTEVEALSLAAHFGYGSFLGAVYAALAQQWEWPGIGGGVAFGLAAWCGGYLGWLPALEMRASATNQPLGRNAMMIAAHVAWGAATGFLHDAQQPARRPSKETAHE